MAEEQTEKQGLTLHPGSSPSSLKNLEEALLSAPVKEFAKLRLSLTLRDGRELPNLVLRAAIKTRERRGETMADCIDQLRLDRTDAPGSQSVWVSFNDIQGWQVDELPGEA